MKSADWNGHRISLLAHAFNLSKGIGVDLHVRAADRDEALIEVWKKLQHHRDFLRKTGGEYDVKFARELEHCQAA